MRQWLVGGGLILGEGGLLLVHNRRRNGDHDRRHHHGVVGFLAFRVMDVFKPYPARQLEHLHGGWGIMADDLMAGVYANLLVRLALRVVPGA